MSNASTQNLDLKKLVALICETVASHSGVELDRVILYGSYAWGNWDSDRSDIDVAVLMRFPALLDEIVDRFLQHRLQIDGTSVVKQVLSSMAEDGVFGTLSSRINFCVRDAKFVEQLRNFAPCMESKLLTNGKVLWSSPEARDYQAASADDARRSVISRGMSAATRILDGARFEYALHDVRKQRLENQNINDEHEWGDNCADAHTAACMCLRAMLYANDIDPSDNSMRWRVGQLIEMLITVIPEAVRLLPCAKSLPDRFTRNLGDFDANRIAAREAIAASIRIHRFAQKTTKWARLQSSSVNRAWAERTAAKIDDRHFLDSTK